ncbi:MAG: hypothetical protein DRQ52_03935 [Gammaproteobacteria bacterium]|nr:MAG: hypothetical protein DRQ52_03935 [Gammaproteobacteria bacterium]RLA54185.1 MAG: hypothetical protein DRR42_02600 [Gammaproteobacteria bacterium]
MAPPGQVEAALFITRLQVGICELIGLLRDAGMQVGINTLVDAQLALTNVAVTRRTDVFWALHAVIVNQPEERTLFSQAFALIWQRISSADQHPAQGVDQTEQKKLKRRLAEALEKRSPQPEDQHPAAAKTTEFESAGSDNPENSSRHSTERRTFSGVESFSEIDFAELSIDELQQVHKALLEIASRFKPRQIRRFEPTSRKGPIDLAKSLRESLRTGGIPVTLRYRQRRRELKPLIVICDISGSMQPYLRPLLLLIHTIAKVRPNVSLFLFGTQLTNVTRQLAQADIDVALEKIATAAPDWRGGTRIGQNLRRFRHNWSRRTGTSRAAVWLVTDGLDRDAGQGLNEEMHNLRKICRSVHWLNPLLRFDEYQPLAAGAKIIADQVDSITPIHSLKHLARLPELLD